jgi:hypothetical protein
MSQEGVPPLIYDPPSDLAARLYAELDPIHFRRVVDPLDTTSDEEPPMALRDRLVRWFKSLDL